MGIPLLASVAAATWMVASPASAMAGYYEELVFKVDLTPYGVQDMSLCVLERSSTALFMTYRTVPRKYVLSDFECGGDDYYSLTPEMENAIKDAGIMPPLEGARIHPLQSLVLAGMMLLGLILFVARLVASRR